MSHDHHWLPGVHSVTRGIGRRTRDRLLGTGRRRRCLGTICAADISGCLWPPPPPPKLPRSLSPQLPLFLPSRPHLREKNKTEQKQNQKKKDSTPECHSFHFFQPPLSQASTIAGLHYIRPPLFHASTIPPVFPTTYSDPAGFILSPPPAAHPSNHPRHDEFTREALIHTTYG